MPLGVSGFLTPLPGPRRVRGASQVSVPGAPAPESGCDRPRSVASHPVTMGSEDTTWCAGERGAEHGFYRVNSGP